ncbi:MAG: PorT family protein [Tannerellaceae bacterium]|jgi:hypothetical protein|nr:PorT family protein [Tannerellaceae bacterium]
MTKRCGLVFLLSALCLLGQAQKTVKPVKVEDKILNWGAKAGLNSGMPVINSITINGKEMENVTANYQVGVTASSFLRINFERFFIQPGLLWSRSSGDIRFTVPGEGEETAPHDDRLSYTIKSFEAPVLIGYKVIKESPYGLSVMAGPNFKYNYNVRYQPGIAGSPHRYLSDSTPWGISIMADIGFSIWRFFFDVSYELGINRIDSDFKDYTSQQPVENEITINKRTNVLSFSLGFLF